MIQETDQLIDKDLSPSFKTITQTIKRVFDSFQIPGYHDDSPNITMHLNGKRIGRRILNNPTRKKEAEIKYAYFYDWHAKDELAMRYGIEAEEKRIRTYAVTKTNEEEHITYLSSISIQEAEILLETMPKGPGNFGYLNDSLIK